MKEIKCRKCKKTVQVEDAYPFSTCNICRAKEKVERELERKSRELIESLKFQNEVPWCLRSFGNFRKCEERFKHPEPTFEQYQQKARECKENEIYQKEDAQLGYMQADFEAKKRMARRMFHKDLFPFTSKECEKFRYMILGVIAKEEDFLKDHISECDECRQWLQQYQTKCLPSQEHEHPFWSRERKKTIEDYEEEQGLKSNPQLDKIMSEIASEDSQRQQEHRELLESRHEEITERKEALEEVKRISRMPKDKLQEWLDSPEDEG